MNKNLFRFLLVASMLPLSACGGTSSDGYSVTLLKPDGTPLGKNEAEVRLVNESETLTAATGKNGKAAFDVSEGIYHVRIGSLPDEYAYDPNAYTVNEDDPEIVITLQECRGVIATRDFTNAEQNDPSRTPKGSGLWLYESRYSLEEGVYRVDFDKEEHALYFAVAPKNTGKYELVSYAEEDCPENHIDPIAGYCGASISYQFETPTEDYDDDEGSVNFRVPLEVTMDDFIKTDETDDEGNLIPERDEDGNMICGSSWTYQVKCKSAENYPAGFYLSLQRTGDVDPEDPEPEKTIPHATETRISPEGGENTEFAWCTFEGEDEPVYNEEDRYYHLNDKDGPLLYASLTGDNPWFDNPISLCAAVQGTSYFITNQGTVDYNDFFSEYTKLCNSDGRTCVTEELKQFLIALEEARVFFPREGLDGYIPNPFKDGYQWLCLVGYYTNKSGTDAAHPCFLENDDSTVTENLASGETMYFAAESDVPATWNVRNENAKMKFVHDGEESYGSAGFVLSLSVSSNDEREIFSVTNTGDKSAYLILQVTYDITGANTDASSLKEGTNQIRISSSEFDSDLLGMNALFVPETAGAFHLEAASVNAYIYFVSDGTDCYYDGGLDDRSASFALSAGESFTIRLGFNDIYQTSGMIYFTLVRE